MEDLEDPWKIEAPLSLRNALGNLSVDERTELVTAKEMEDYDTLVDLMNAKFSALPADQENEIQEYYDRKNCAELGIPYRNRSATS